MNTPTNMMNPILILEKIPGSDTVEPNVYGFETIRIWQFDFDGQGGALVTYDDNSEFDACYGESLYYLLFGNPGSGHRWYRPANLGGMPEPKMPTMF